MKPDYRIGKEARKNFEDKMQKLFRVPKLPKQQKPPKKTASEEKQK
jgi:hypothetical protein